MDVVRRLLARIDGGAALLLLLPAVLCALDPETFLPDMFANGLDPNMYTGYFTNIHHLEMFRDTYYGSRLPWITPGYLAYKLLPPLAAHHVLHLTFHSAAVLALYFILGRTVGRRAGFAAAALFAANSTVIGIFTWDFPDGAAICYYLLTLAALTRAAESTRPAPALIGAGAAMSAALFTYTVWWPAAPCPVVYWLMANRAGMRHPLWKAALWTAAGAGALIVGLGTFSVAKGADFLFFVPMITYTLSISGQNPGKLPDYGWLSDSPWLVIPALAVGAVILRRAFGGRDPRLGSAALRFQILFLLQLAILILMELRGQAPLQTGYQADSLLPASFLVLGSFAADILSGMSRRQFAFVCAAGAGAIMLGHVWHYSLWLPDLPFAKQLNRWVVFLPGMLALSLLAAGARLPAFGRAACAAAAPLLLMFPNRVQDIWRISLASGWEISRNADPHPRSEAFLAVIEAASVLRKADRDCKAFFWYDVTEPGGGLFVTICSLKLWLYRLTSEQFPTLNGSGQPLEAGQTLALLSFRTDAPAGASDALRDLGWTARLKSSHEVVSGRIRLFITFINIDKAAPNSAGTEGLPRP